jgi:predicted RNase H-like nuclease (RuvC/YqgF family)
MSVDTYAELVRTRKALLALEKEIAGLKEENLSLRNQIEEQKDEIMSLFSFIQSNG